jgi:hypothetical protein
MNALMEKVVHDDNANNDEKNDSKLNENIRSPGKPGGIFRRRMEVPYSFLFSDFELCLSCVAFWIRLWNWHLLFPLSLETLCLIVGITVPLFCYSHVNSTYLL